MGCRQSRIVPITDSVEPKKRSQLSSEMCAVNIFDCAGNKQVVLTPSVRTDASVFTPIVSGVEAQQQAACTYSQRPETATTRIAVLTRPRGARGRHRLQQPLQSEETAAAYSSAAVVLKRPMAAVYTRRPTRVTYTRFSEEWMAARDRRVGFSSSNVCTRFPPPPPRAVSIHDADEITVRPLAARTRRGAWYETSVQPSAQFRLHRHH